jgi:hypothetical protein
MVGVKKRAFRQDQYQRPNKRLLVSPRCEGGFDTVSLTHFIDAFYRELQRSLLNLRLGAQGDLLTLLQVVAVLKSGPRFRPPTG